MWTFTIFELVLLTLVSSGEFPVFPPNYPKDFNPTDGHLKPFGWQRKPEGHVKEYDDVLTPQSLHEHHVRPKVPLVYRGAVSKSKAIALWSDDYLNKTYGELDVLVELKKENRSFTTGRMRFRRFLDLYGQKKLYIVSLLPKEMMKDVQAVNSVMCGTFRNFTHESNLWMSAGGTRSVIHYDADENIHCMLAGRKDFMVVEEKYEAPLYFMDLDETAGSSFTEVNPDSVDLEKYPDIINVPWTYATLYPGDCIYLPSRYIHQVRSYGRSIAVTTLFTNGISNFIGKDLEYDNGGCETFDSKSYHTLDDIDFHWTYEKGDETVDMGYMNVETIRLYLLRTAKAFKTLNFERFRDFYDGFNYGEGALDAKQVFDVLTRGDQELTVADVKALTRDELKYLGRGMDPPHGPSAEGGKEVFFMPGDMSEEKDESEVERSRGIREDLEQKFQSIEVNESGDNEDNVMEDLFLDETNAASRNKHKSQIDPRVREDL